MKNKVLGVCILLTSAAVSAQATPRSWVTAAVANGVSTLEVSGDAAKTLFDSLPKATETFVTDGQYFAQVTRAGKNIVCVDDVTVIVRCKMQFDPLGVTTAYYAS